MKTIETAQALKDIAAFRQILDVRETKYRRNWMRYANAGVRRADLRDLGGQPFGMWQTTLETDTGGQPIVQLCKSLVDTLTSKLSQTKVRPFFTPIAGDWETRKACREIQIFFDELFDRQNVHIKGVKAARDAFIFDTGVFWIDEETAAIQRVTPWEVYFDPSELNYGQITRCFIRQVNYPLIYLKEKFEKSEYAERYSGYLKDYRGVKVERIVYYDLIEKRRIDLIGDCPIAETDLGSEVWPFALFWYTDPVAGYRTTSIVDDSMGHQVTCDMLTQRIKDAAELTPANAIFLDANINIKASQLSTRIGEIYTYAGGASGAPPVVSTPRPIDPSYLELLKYWIGDAYQMTGISQLSAQSKKPSGINSGVALDTLQDVESERFNVMLQSFIRFFVDVARIYMEIVPEDADVLPAKTGRAKVSWKDVKKARNRFTVQFSAASSLSKDPKVKMEQIEKLIAMKIINPDLAASLLEMPDIENAYNVATAAHDAAQATIGRAIDDGTTEFNEVIGLDMLFRECVSTILQLDAAGENQAVILRVVALMENVKNKMDEVNAELAPPPPPLPPAAPAPVEMMPPGVVPMAPPMA